jgi:hypothetical protein
LTQHIHRLRIVRSTVLAVAAVRMPAAPRAIGVPDARLVAEPAPP